MISALLSILLAWFFAAIVLLLLLHGRTLRALWREPALACPVVIVESDDWGVGPVSDAEVLGSIADVLGSVRDATGRPAVMTLGVVSGHPDGVRILASGITRYHRQTLFDPKFARIADAMRAGCAAGVFAPQWHGLEHCWPASLLARARDDERLQRWLADPAARSEALPSVLQSRWVDTAGLPSRPLAREDVESAVGDEAVLLRQLFGRVPTVAVPNTFVWNEDVERAWVTAGVTSIVTPGHRCEGRDADGALQAPTRAVRNGERSLSGAVFVVRDDYFEPIRGHRAEQVWEAVARKRRLGRPILLEMHRENFIASPDSARVALHELERALHGVLHRNPDTRFMTTADLACLLSDTASPLRVQGGGRWLCVLARRLACDASLARFLKYSGLRGALLLFVHMSDSVTHGRFAIASQ